MPLLLIYLNIELQHFYVFYLYKIFILIGYVISNKLYTNNTKGVENLKSSAVSGSFNSGIALKIFIVAFDESNIYNFPKPIFNFTAKKKNIFFFIDNILKLKKIRYIFFIKISYKLRLK